MLKVLEGPSLAERTTLRLGGRALAEVRVTSRDALDDLPGVLQRLGGSPLMLGCGSNILAADGELPVVVVSVDMDDAPAIVGETAEGVVVRVGAATRLPRLLGQLASWGLSGLEGLAGIPGSVGGAVAMNAGSYGCEFGTVLRSVEVFSPDFGLADVPHESIEYAYRHFGLKGCHGWFVVTGADIVLRRGESAAITAAMRANYLKKKSTQPVLARSAGCVFRNPAPGVSAGRLIDEAGLRGKRIGGMAFSEVHANFLVNEGAGRSDEAFELLQLAKEIVKRRHGMDLTLEVKILSWP